MKKLPPMIGVQSSHIAAIGYRDKDLFVRFAGGMTYRYEDVPSTLYYDGLGADSVGQWFRENIRGHFKHHKLDA